MRLKLIFCIVLATTPAVRANICADLERIANAGRADRFESWHDGWQDSVEDYDDDEHIKYVKENIPTWKSKFNLPGAISCSIHENRVSKFFSFHCKWGYQSVNKAREELQKLSDQIASCYVREIEEEETDHHFNIPGGSEDYFNLHVMEALGKSEENYTHTLRFSYEYWEPRE